MAEHATSTQNNHGGSWMKPIRIAAIIGILSAVICVVVTVGTIAQHCGGDYKARTRRDCVLC